MEIVLLIYGLTFFLLGTAIVVQPRRDSRFALARTLWLLAAFALLHGINEWLDMVSLAREPNRVLSVIGPALLLASFGFLFEFGRRLVAMSLHASTPNAWGALIQWPIYVFLVSVLAITVLVSSSPWRDLSVWGRYLVGFPGALLAGFGLVLYYRLEVLRLQRLRVTAHFFVGGAAFVAYGS